MKREKGGNLLDFMNVELMLEHVLTVMLVTPSQRYEKKTGRSESDFTHLLCSRVASAFFFVLFGVVNLQRAHIEFSRSKSKQAFKRQKGKRKRGQRSAEVSGQVVQTAWLRVDICGHLWTFSSLTATVGLVWKEVLCKSVEVEELNSLLVSFKLKPEELCFILVYLTLISLSQLG